MSVPAPRLLAPPWEVLHERLLALAAARIVAGDAAGGTALRAAVDAWWEEQRQWNAGIAGLLSVHHEINNALVGVSGNVQLLLMGPAGREPGVRERLEVVAREAQRVRDAARKLGELRGALAAAGDRSGGTGRVAPPEPA